LQVLSNVPPVSSANVCHCWKSVIASFFSELQLYLTAKALEIVKICEVTQPATHKSSDCHFCRIWQFLFKAFTWRLHFLFDFEKKLFLIFHYFMYSWFGLVHFSACIWYFFCIKSPTAKWKICVMLYLLPNISCLNNLQLSK
jgi:hypothetical protein